MSKKNDKPKKDKKPKDPNAKKRNQTPWLAKQLLRCTKVFANSEKLHATLLAAQAPNVDLANVEHVKLHSTALLAQLTALPADWKPAKGNKPGTSKKVGVGSIICVKTDLNRDETKIFKHTKVEMFDNAVVIDDDGRDWWVKCSDGITRVLRKKLAQKAAPAAVPSTTEAETKAA